MGSHGAANFSCICSLNTNYSISSAAPAMTTSAAATIVTDVDSAVVG